jgi:hypothetical protein
MNTSTTGFYSLVQYCPDRSREEAVNLGVVLISPAHGFIGSKMSSRSERLRKFFGETLGDVTQVSAIRRMLEHRFRDDASLSDPEKFEDFRRSLANEFQLSSPRPIRVENPEAELFLLFGQLVEIPEPANPLPSVPGFEHLDEILRTSRFKGIVKHNVQVRLPILDRSLNVPYAFQNGRFNLIQTQRFTQKTEEKLLAEAYKRAAQGHLLYKHPVPGVGECKLVVVGAIGEVAKPRQEKIRQLLADHDVDFYNAERIDELTEKIATTGHFSR